MADEWLLMGSAQGDLSGRVGSDAERPLDGEGSGSAPHPTQPVKPVQFGYAPAEPGARVGRRVTQTIQIEPHGSSTH